MLPFIDNVKRPATTSEATARALTATQGPKIQTQALTEHEKRLGTHNGKACEVITHDGDRRVLGGDRLRQGFERLLLISQRRSDPPMIRRQTQNGNSFFRTNSIGSSWKRQF